MTTCPVCRAELFDAGPLYPDHNVRRPERNSHTVGTRSRWIVTPCPMVGEPIRVHA